MKDDLQRDYKDSDFSGAAFMDSGRMDVQGRIGVSLMPRSCDGLGGRQAKHVYVLFEF
jgi:hypothetical protein